MLFWSPFISCTPIKVILKFQNFKADKMFSRLKFILVVWLSCCHRLLGQVLLYLRVIQSCQST